MTWPTWCFWGMPQVILCWYSSCSRDVVSERILGRSLGEQSLVHLEFSSLVHLQFRSLVHWIKVRNAELLSNASRASARTNQQTASLGYTVVPTHVSHLRYRNNTPTQKHLAPVCPSCFFPPLYKKQLQGSGVFIQTSSGFQAFMKDSFPYIFQPFLQVAL